MQINIHSLTETATLINKSVRQVQRDIAANKIRTVNIDGVKFVPQSEIDRITAGVL